MLIPEILPIAPPSFAQPKGNPAISLRGSRKSAGLSVELCVMAKQQSVNFIDASLLIHCSGIEGVHLDRDQHQILAVAVAQYVAEEIWQNRIEADD